MPSVSDLWALLKKVDRLLELEEKQAKAIAGLQDQINDLTTRVTKLETRDEVLIARAEAAAGMAAMGAATASMSDISRRVGALEERTAPVILPSPTRSKRLPKAP